MNENELNNLYQQVAFVLECKTEELKQGGYREICEADVWSCLTSVYWRHKSSLMLHQAVSDIFGLTNKEVMDYLQLQIVKQPIGTMTDVFQQIIK